jgi:hypothetical protein
MQYEQLFLISLLLTVLIEGIVVVVLARYFYGMRNYFGLIATSFLASALTLPYFWFVLPIYIHQRLLYIVVGESIIVLVEAFIYWRSLKIKPQHALTISLVANIVSIAAGLLLM